MRGFVEATSLLTRIPGRSTADARRALPWFPVVGGLIGLAVAAVYAAARFVMPPLVSATLAVGAGIALTGALHEDGLADTADAFVMHAGRERTVAVLKDPRLGTYGVAALIVGMLLRVSAVASLGPANAFLALGAAHSIGRGASLAATRFAPLSSSSTLGAAYANDMSPFASTLAAASALSIAGAALGAWGVAALAIGIATALCMARGARRRIGGLTGDVFGAVEQITETGVLLLAVAIRRQLPWWDA